MIDIRDYKVVHKNKVYHGLTMDPLFPHVDSETLGEVIPAEHMLIIAMDLHNGAVVSIEDMAYAFAFVKVG